MIYPTLLTLIAALSLSTATPVKRTDAYLLHAKNSPDNVSYTSTRSLCLAPRLRDGIF
jgi:type IV secretory pathway component VirB8